MPPQTPDPKGPAATNPQQPASPNPAPLHQSGAGHVDFDKLLLPKKNVGASKDSAQRINAGVLFEQEQTAGREGIRDGSAPAQTPPPAKKEEAPVVRSLQTYQGDIQSLVGEKNISVVSIAAAEADRRGMGRLQDGQAPLNQDRGRPWLSKTLTIGGGVLLLLIIAGGGYYAYLRSLPVSVAVQSPAPFISVDDTQPVQLAPDETRATLMQKLVRTRAAVALSLGLIERLQVVKPTAAGDAVQEVGAPELLPLLAPTIPQELVRTLEPQMLVGVHVYDENESFMILRADSYETAYSGMLAWEASMQGDLLPLFSRTPAVHARADAPARPVATTTPQAQFFQGNFVDQIVQNHDTRVVLNQQGDILLLWTFLDRGTIVITTNEATLREIISRLSHAPILSLPANK